MRRFIHITLVVLLVFTVWCVVWGMLSFVPGCGGADDAVCVVRMGPMMTGCGVLVGVKDKNRTRIVFLTARHVATGCRFFLRPSCLNSICAKSAGRSLEFAHITNINPVRWFCSDEDIDLAWFELTPDEIRKIAGDGRLPSHVALDGDSFGDGVVATFDRERALAISRGDTVSVARIARLPLLGLGINLPLIPLSGRSLMFTSEESSAIAEMFAKTNITYKYNLNLKQAVLWQNIVPMKLSESDSGTPVFVAKSSDDSLPSLAGIVVSQNDNNALGGFQPVRKAVALICNSVLKGEGLRLINESRFW